MRRSVIALLLGALLLAGCSQGGNESTVEITGTAPAEPSGTPSQTAAPSGAATEEPGGPPEVVETIATGLAAPWGLDFFANGDALVTERDTRRVLLIRGPEREVVELGTLGSEVAAGEQGEAGLLGVAVSPDVEQDESIYFYLSTPTDNRVVRVSIAGGELGEPEPIFTGIPNGFIHDGGRLEFGPDGFLYVSTGESGEPSLAQDRESLGGKILRLRPNGQPAPGNPFDTAVWSWGHRNVQGLAFDDAGRLWASEFGADAFDELNLIEAGDNYGWPDVEGAGGRGELVDPQLVWDTDEASPSGLAHLDGYLWMAALQGERLWRVQVDREGASNPRAFFVGDYGRMRTVAVAPDGMLWVTTSNRDGRGEPGPDDDQILLVEP